MWSSLVSRCRACGRCLCRESIPVARIAEKVTRQVIIYAVREYLPSCKSPVARALVRAFAVAPSSTVCR